MEKKRLCVILHLYYQNMWDEIKEYLINLQNISGFDLFITCIEENNNLFNDIYNSFNKSVNVKIDLVKNTKGADVYPFFHILNKINLDDYSLIFKIHTKQNFTRKLTCRLPKITNVKFYVGYKLWRNFLLEAILGKQNIPLILETFKKNNKTGMMGFDPLLVEYNKEIITFPHNFNEIASDYNLLPLNKYKCFVGTIFVIRASLLKCIQNKYGLSDFEVETDEKFVRLAWTMESLFGYLVEAQGYEITNFYPKEVKKNLTILSNKITLLLYKFYINKILFKRNKSSK